MQKYRTVLEPNEGGHILIVSDKHPEQPITWGNLYKLLKDNESYKLLFDQNRDYFENDDFKDVLVGFRAENDARILVKILNQID